MATILSTLETRLNYRAQNAAGDIPTSEIDACINAAIQEINRRCPFLPYYGTITADGTNYRFDLTDATKLVPNTSGHVFMRLRTVSIEGYGFLTSHPEGIDYIRKLRSQTTSMLSNPVHPVMDGTHLVFDSVMSSGTVVVIDGFRKHKTLTATVSPGDLLDTVEGVLGDGWDRLILSGAQIQLGEDLGSDTKGKQLIEEATPIYKEQLADFKKVVSQNLEYMRESRAQGYQDFRNNLGGSEINVNLPYTGNPSAYA